MHRRDFLRAAAAVPLVNLPLAEPRPAHARQAVRKLFITGGAFNKKLIMYAASLTGKQNPRICFLPHASGDAPGGIVQWFEMCADLPVRPFVQRSFISSYTQQDSFEKVLTSMDAILVGGGNTLNMIAVWKAQGIDLALRRAWDNGILLGGGSAGSLCWFEHGTTDSRPGALSTVEGLGFMKGSHCPHYHAEPQRKPLYWSKIQSGDYKPGYACDDRAGIYFENEEVKQVVALDQESNCYFVSASGGQVTERVLPKQII